MNAAFIAFTLALQLCQRCKHPQAPSKSRRSIRIYTFMRTPFGSQLRRGKRIQMIDIRRVIVAALFCVLIGNLCAADRIRINVRQSDSAIRQQLFELTPPGTSTGKVYQFAESRLHRESPVVGWPPRKPNERFGNFIYTWLGHYREL